MGIGLLFFRVNGLFYMLYLFNGGTKSSEKKNKFIHFSEVKHVFTGHVVFQLIIGSSRLFTLVYQFHFSYQHGF
jgi:hypothetical protein